MRINTVHALTSTAFWFIAAACAPQPEPEHPEAPPSSAVTPQEAPAAPELTPLKVATWNLEWLHRSNGAGNVQRQDEDYARLKTYAERLGADVIAVQEVDGEAALQRVFDDAIYDYHVASQSGVQLAGFVYRTGLQVVEHPDVTAINTTGSVRNGVDMTVTVNGQPIRMLSVHLKSGCFDNPLSASTSACRTLAQQLPQLEAWIDARAAANEPFIVLGDFNRRMKTGEPFYTEIDDAEPPDADLELVTDGRTSECWDGEFPEYIDHAVLSKTAAAWLTPGSFAQLIYDAEDAAFKDTLSDHCPVSVELLPSGAPQPQPQPEPNPTPEPQPEPSPGPVKGNINSQGRKLYHVAGCPQYEATQIDESAGERYFATEAEAIAAGWVKAGNCP